MIIVNKEPLERITPVGSLVILLNGEVLYISFGEDTNYKDLCNILLNNFIEDVFYAEFTIITHSEEVNYLDLLIDGITLEIEYKNLVKKFSGQGIQFSQGKFLARNDRFVDLYSFSGLEKSFEYSGQDFKLTKDKTKIIIFTGSIIFLLSVETGEVLKKCEGKFWSYFSDQILVTRDLDEIVSYDIVSGNVIKRLSSYDVMCVNDDFSIIGRCNKTLEIDGKIFKFEHPYWMIGEKFIYNYCYGDLILINKKGERISRYDFGNTTSWITDLRDIIVRFNHIKLEIYSLPDFSMIYEYNVVSGNVKFSEDKNKLLITRDNLVIILDIPSKEKKYIYIDTFIKEAHLYEDYLILETLDDKFYLISLI